MNKGLKIILGLFTLWPPVYIIIFLFWFMSMFFSMTGPSIRVENQFFTFVVMHILTMLLMFVLMTIYLINVYRNVNVDKDKKLLWTVLILFGSMVAMPIYWYSFIWKEPTQNN
ncbi:MAG: hypothetical protein Q8942_09605 [Bacillota bacterium]|nr:hypothetical protein [Bacillota bacterium]